MGTWATGRSRQSDYTGDADGDIIMDNEPIEWDHNSYPPLNKPQNMNAMIQCLGKPTQKVGHMAEVSIA